MHFKFIVFSATILGEMQFTNHFIRESNEIYQLPIYISVQKQTFENCCSTVIIILYFADTSGIYMYILNVLMFIYILCMVCWAVPL